MEGISGDHLGIIWVPSSRMDPLCEKTNKMAWPQIRRYALALGLTVGCLISWSFASTLPVVIASVVSLMVGYIYFLYQHPQPFVVPEDWEDILSGPISVSLFQEPVITNCGHTYERTQVNEARRKGHVTCSVCREPFERLRKNRLIVGLLNHLNGGKDPKVFIEAHRYETSVGPDGHSYACVTEGLIQRAKELYGQLTYEEFIEQNRVDIYKTDTERVREDVNLEAIESILTAEDRPAFDAGESARVADYAERCFPNLLWLAVLEHLQKLEYRGE